VKHIKITTTGLYADPIPSLPHLRVEEGDVIELREQFAEVMVNEYKSAEYTDAPSDDADSESVDESPDDEEPDQSDEPDQDADVAALMEAHSKKVLQAACVNSDLDDSGSKTELATRLVENGITEIVTE